MSMLRLFDKPLVPGVLRTYETGYFNGVAETKALLAEEIAQLKFLLDSAPMIEAPKDAWAAHSVAAFAYVHPKTVAKIRGAVVSDGYATLAPGPTKWILTSLMPEGRVIYSSFAIPGLEKIVGPALVQPAKRKRYVLA